MPSLNQLCPCQLYTLKFKSRQILFLPNILKQTNAKFPKNILRLLEKKESL